MREIKFRAWHNTTLDGEHVMSPHEEIVRNCSQYLCDNDSFPNRIIMQYTGLKDMNGKEIYEGDILRFADKWEWYKGEYGIKMMAADTERKRELKVKYDAEPYEERVVESIEDYEWLLSSEIQQYWEVIGNIHQNPELLK